jgi:murein hydrolase activator
MKDISGMMELRSLAESYEVRSLFWVSCILFILSGTMINSARASSRLDDLNVKLDSLSTVKSAATKELNSLGREEKNALDELNRLDRRSRSIKKMLSSLQEEASLLKKQTSIQKTELNICLKEIDRLDIELNANQTDRQFLLNECSRIANKMFRYRKQDPLFWLLSAKSAGEALKRVRLYRWFQQGLTNRMDELQQKNIRLVDLKTNRELAGEKQAGLLKDLRLGKIKNEKSQSENQTIIVQLKQNSKQRTIKLQQVQQDKELKGQYLDQLSQAGSKVATMLSALRENWEKREAELSYDQARRSSLESSFANGTDNIEVVIEAPVQKSSKSGSLDGISRASRGKLPRPVTGKINRKYGLFTDPRLGTTTDNPGIDFNCAQNTNIKAVDDGIVARVTWIPGFGNTVLVNHGKGAFSVYAKMDEVYVSQSQNLNVGQVIGKSGHFDQADQGSLHFEIWINDKSENPELWLQK